MRPPDILQSLLVSTPFLLFTNPQVALAASSSKKPPAANAILLSEVQSLTLRGNGALTTGRRSSPVPQLQCESSLPGICDLYEIDVLRCTNMGSSYGPEDIEWSCTASLPPELRLASTEVGCEGYRNADDEFVLKGSCGVVYRMVLTEEGAAKFPELAAGKKGRRSPSSKGGANAAAGRKRTWSEAVFGVLFWLFFGGVVLAVIYGLVSALPGISSANGHGRRGGAGGGHGGPPYGGGGGGWGGGGWGDDDPPPPYNPGSGGGYGRSSYKPPRSRGWEPGFYSGLATGTAAGGAAGYTAGRHSASRASQSPSSSSSSRQAGGSSSSGISSSRHTSTGFGSTSRR